MPGWAQDVVALAAIAGCVLAIVLGVRKGRSNRQAMISAAEARGEAKATAALHAQQTVAVPVNVSVGDRSRSSAGDLSELVRVVRSRPELVADMLRRPWAYDELDRRCEVRADGGNDHDDLYHDDAAYRVLVASLGSGGVGSPDTTERGRDLFGGDDRARGRGPGA